MPDISIGRLRGGYCVYWRDGDGRKRRYQLKARTAKEAEAEAIDVYRKNGPQSAPSGLTVAALWAAYVDDLGSKTTAKTMGYTGKAVLAHFGHLRPDQITREHCRSYDAKRRADGKSQGTVHTEMGHLRSTMRFAADVLNVIERPPAIWRPQKPVTDKRILDAAEMRRLIDGTSAPHIRLAITLLLGTAARVGAVLDLTWDRVDFDRGVINLRLDDSLTRKGRAVLPMSHMTRAALTSAYEAALSDYVIEHNGNPVKKITTGFSAAVRRSKIGHVRIHDLRHTAAVTMLQAGVPLTMVSQVLGHSNTSVTERVYARYLPDHMSEAVEVLDFTKIRSVQ